MNALRIAIPMLMAATLVAMAEDPKLGDSKDTVLDSLGNPKGRMVLKNLEALFYDRGSVELTDGKVSAVKLVTAEQLAKKQADQAEQDRKNAESRAKLIAEGAAEKQRMLADPAFVRKTPAEQADAWRKFAARYPGVDVAGELQVAQQDANAEAQQKAAVAAPKPEQPTPKLSSSKLRKLRRTLEPKEQETK